jgi:plasmid maintenance system antidote protein VapI
MANIRISDQAVYNPNYLLDELIKRLNLKNDAALSRALEVAPPVISKIRHNTLPIGATILIRMHEISEISIRELREMLAYPGDSDSSLAA